MEIDIYIIDTDCLYYLLGSKIGSKILKVVKIIIPESIFFELTRNYQVMLNKFNFEKIQLDDKQRNVASKMLRKISNKNIANNYLLGRRTRRIKNIGECEGYALCKSLKGTMVLLDREARSLIKKAFKNDLNCNYENLTDFGLRMLESSKDKEAFKEEMWEKYRIKL